MHVGKPENRKTVDGSEDRREMDMVKAPGPLCRAWFGELGRRIGE